MSVFRFLCKGARTLIKSSSRIMLFWFSIWWHTIMFIWCISILYDAKVQHVYVTYKDARLHVVLYMLFSICFLFLVILFLCCFFLFSILSGEAGFIPRLQPFLLLLHQQNFSSHFCLFVFFSSFNLLGQGTLGDNIVFLFLPSCALTNPFLCWDR